MPFYHCFKKLNRQWIKIGQVENHSIGFQSIDALSQFVGKRNCESYHRSIGADFKVDSVSGRVVSTTYFKKTD